MSSDEGDEPEINYHSWMAKIHRQKSQEMVSKKHKDSIPSIGPPFSITQHRHDSESTVGSIPSGSFFEKEKQETNFFAVLFRLFGALFFIGIGIGALVFSVYKSPFDPQQHTTVRKSTYQTTTPPKICNPFVTCNSTKGTYTYTRHTKSQNGTSVDVEISVPAQWFQVHEKQFVMFSIDTTLIPMINQTLNFSRIIAYSNATYTIGSKGKICSCSRETYMDFINSFGNENMKYETTIDFEAHGYRRLWQFWDVLSKTAMQFRYVDPQSFLPIAWATYPVDDPDDVNHHHDYWFGDMKHWENPVVTPVPSICFSVSCS